MAIATNVRQTDRRWRTAAIALIALVAALLVPASGASAAGTGTVTGTVTTEGGSPIQGIQVSVETAHVNEDGTTTWTEHQTTQAVTGVDGTYTATVPPGTQYRVGFHGSGFVPEWYDDALSRETGDNVTVTDGGTTANVNASLTASRGGLSGTVRNFNGEPIVNVPVSVLSLTVDAGGTRTWRTVASTTTSAQGTYLIRNLDPGTYRLGFLTTAYEPRYYPHANNVEEGSDLFVTDGVTLANLDVFLAFPGNIRGRIRNADGTPYTSGGKVEALRETEVTIAPGQVKTFWEVAGEDTTLVNGNYDFFLPEDRYRLRFTLPDGSKGYLPNLSGLRTADNYFVFSESTTAVPDLLLPGFGTVSGRVFDSDGNAVGAGAAEIELYYDFVDQVEDHVNIRSWERVRSVPTDATGRFSVRALPRDYKVRINTPGIGRAFDEYYLDKPATSQGFDDADLVRVFSFSDTSIGNLFVGEQKSFANVAAPWVEGAAKAGQTLTAHPGTFTPAGASLSVQWLANGTPISGANDLTYQLPSFGQTGTRYAIRVTAFKSPLTPLTVTSLPTGGSVNFLGTAPFENRALPTISGSLVTGGTLTAGNGQWSEPADGFTYQWLADGVSIAGATARTLALTGDEHGKRISVRVTAASGNRAASGTSAQTAVVTAGGITSKEPPTITGTATVGKELVAEPGTWSVTEPKLAYQWLADGAAVAGATTKTFTPGQAELGRRISVRVTASKTGYLAGSEESARTAPVSSEPAVSNTALPSVTGSPAVGKVLTAMEGTWDPAPTSFGYQWLADGEPITGATQKTYTPAKADTSKRIAVRVTARRSGLVDGVATSAPTAPVTDIVPITVTEGPSVVGVPSFGRTLVADPGDYAPDDVELVYQWARDGNGIPGAKGRTYQVTSRDLGKRISVHVGYVRAGSDPVVKTSAPTAVATTKASLSISKQSMTRGARVTADVFAAGVNRVRGLVVATERGLVLQSARLRGGVAVLTIRNLAPGRHRIKVAFSGDPRVKRKARTVTVSVAR